MCKTERASLFLMTPSPSPLFPVYMGGWFQTPDTRAPDDASPCHGTIRQRDRQTPTDPVPALLTSSARLKRLAATRAPQVLLPGGGLGHTGVGGGRAGGARAARDDAVPLVQDVAEGAAGRRSGRDKTRCELVEGAPAGGGGAVLCGGG